MKEGCDGRGRKGEGGKGGEEGGEGERRGRERRDGRGRIKRGGEEDGSLGGIQIFFCWNDRDFTLVFRERRV